MEYDEYWRGFWLEISPKVHCDILCGKYLYGIKIFFVDWICIAKGYR